MKTKPAYLVIDTQRRGAPAIVRSTQLWPALQPGEIAVRVSLEVPDEIIPTGVYALTMDDPEALAIAAEPVAVEPPPDDEEGVAA